MKSSKSSKKEYTIGFPVNYDGPTQDQCITSYQTLMLDLSIQAGIAIPPKSQNVIEKSITQFITCFFNEARKKKSGKEVQSFTDLCKLRSKELLAVANCLAIGDYAHLYDSIYLVSGSNSCSVNLSDLSYFPKDLKGMFIHFQSLGLTLDQVSIEHQPRFYIYLYKLLFEVVKVISQYDITSYDQDAANQMLLVPVSMGNLFEKCNPTKDIMKEYANNLLTILRSPGTTLSNEFIRLFERVKKDILNPYCKLEYVKQFKLARDKFRIRKFSNKDFYATLKASTSTIEIDGKRRKYPSFISSIFEYDPLRGSPEVTAFDDFVGYESSYITQEELKNLPWKVMTMTVITQMIENPSKFKPRGIHNGTNALQDRCNWLHHQLQPFLFSMPTDCMINHQHGVDFLMEVTSPQYRKEKHNSLFVSDFSNATDTLNQEFQCLCLGILFPSQIVDFWRFVSQLPKEFRMPDGKEFIHYVQETGQPQGLLGSFDAFSLAHHILMLMLMKMCNLEDIDSLDFYRILGDDSIVSFPTLDMEYLVYKNHSWLCEQANLLKNDSKTAKSFFNLDTNDYPDDILDFAKVSISKGTFLTPLPVGLGASYASDPAITKISALIWYNYHKVTFTKLLHHIIFQCYGKRDLDYLMAEAILTSGQIPYLSSFKDEKAFRLIETSIRGLSIYAYGISEFQNTVLGYFISETNKQNKMYSALSFEQVWAGFFPFEEMEEWTKSIPANHKFWLIVQENADLADDIQALFDIGDPRLVTAIGGLLSRVDIDDSLESLLSWIHNVDSADNQNDLWNLFCYLDYERLFGTLAKDINNLQVKSFTKVSQDISKFLYNALRCARKRKYFNLEIPQDIIISSKLNLLNYIIDQVYPATT